MKNQKIAAELIKMAKRLVKRSDFRKLPESDEEFRDMILDIRELCETMQEALPNKLAIEVSPIMDAADRLYKEIQSYYGK